MVAPLKVGIAGLGTVGAEVVRLIETESRTLSARCGRGVRVVAVTARSKAKKRVVDLNGIAWAKSPLALAMLRRGFQLVACQRTCQRTCGQSGL